MITYKIHLIRHGMTDGNVDGRYIGRTDMPLCDEGRDELYELLDHCEYPGVQMVYTSPLRRCTETAEILYPNSYAQVMDKLIEMDFGEFEGKLFAELTEHPEFASWMSAPMDYQIPGGEVGRDFVVRIIEAISAIFSGMMEEKMDEVAVVTHGGVIMSLLGAMGIPRRPMGEWAVRNGRGYTLLLTPQMWMRDHAFEIFACIPAAEAAQEEELI